MAEIRCPMCSKPNPDDLEICQYCQARLKPLVVDPSAPQDNSDLPDWLRSLGEDFSDEDEGTFELDGEQEPQDWLERLEPEAEQASEAPESSDEDERQQPDIAADEPDWLQDFRTLEGEAEQDEFLEEEEAANQEQAVPDWMKASGLAPDDAEDDLTPDWLGRFGESQEADAQNLPDWLGSLSTDAEQETQAFDEAENVFQDEDDDTPEVELPDWLAAEEQSLEPPASEPFESVAPLATGELPDWLSSLSPMETEEPPGSEPDEDDQDFSDWLAEEPDVLPVEEPEPDLPDWLSEIGGQPPAAAEEPDQAEVEPDLPSWLDSEAVPEPEPEDAEEAEMPDWLSTLEGFSVPDEPQPPLTLDDVQMGDQESRAVPGWLREMEDSTEVEFGDDAGAGWGDEEAESEPVVGKVSPFVRDDDFETDLFDASELPDWISDEPEETAEPVDDELAAADLPSWVQAMRPVEPDSQPDRSQGPMETAGPLSGLHSVLSAELEIAQIKKPPAYSSKLRFSEAQQFRAELLENLLSTEGQTKPIPRPAIVSTQSVLRGIVGVILVALLGLLIATGSQVVPLPQITTIPREVSRASGLVQNLPAEARVLVAFDYEPGMSGEMQVAAASVVNHLMLKAARLTVVSSSPTGPALAEHFIHTIQARHDYQSGRQYINLGYIPGGITGLLSFAQIPERVTPRSFDGQDAWASEPLSGINTLADFDMLVVITDNPNTGRAWIEQVHPAMETVPFITVISAQAEPLIRPYYGLQNAQVDGMVSGVLGGAFYEQATQSNQARLYWDAFNLGLVLAVAAILIGGVMQIITLILARRAEQRGEAA